MSARSGWTFLGALLAFAGPASAETLTLPFQGAALRLQVPADCEMEWSEEAEAGVFTQKQGTNAKLMMDLIPLPPGSPLRDPEQIKAGVEEMGREELPTAVQKELELIELKAPAGRGWLFHLTQKATEKGENDFAELRSGSLLLGDHLLVISIYSHPADAAFVAKALAALESLQLVR